MNGATIKLDQVGGDTRYELSDEAIDAAAGMSSGIDVGVRSRA